MRGTDERLLSDIVQQKSAFDTPPMPEERKSECLADERSGSGTA